MSSLDGCRDLRQDLLRFPEDFVSRDSQHFISPLTQIFIAYAVVVAALFGEVIFAIDFDNEFQSNATEVDGIRFNHMFTTKLLATAPAVANHLPNILREFIGGCPLVSCELGRFVVAFRHGCFDFDLKWEAKALGKKTSRAPFSPSFAVGEGLGMRGPARSLKLDV